MGEYLKLKICRSCRLSFAIVFHSWKRSFAPLCIPSCKWHTCSNAAGKTCDRLAFHLVGELRYSQMPHVTEFRNISIHVGHIAHVHLHLVPLAPLNHTAVTWETNHIPPGPLHLTAFFTHTVCCLEIWIWRKQLERRRAHTWTVVETYKLFSSRKGGFTVQGLNLYRWPFHIYLLRSQHIECIARREPSFNSDSTSKTDENSWWCQKNPKSKSCPWLHESSWKQVEQFAKFIFTSQEAFSCTGAGNRA